MQMQKDKLTIEFTYVKDHSCYTLMLLASLQQLLGQVQQLYINIHTWTHTSTDSNFPAIQSTQQSFTDYEQASLPPTLQLLKRHQATAPLHNKKWSRIAPRFEVKEDIKSKQYGITQMAICQNTQTAWASGSQFRGGGLDNWGHKPNQN